jgi:hypothetical protein
LYMPFLFSLCTLRSYSDYDPAGNGQMGVGGDSISRFDDDSVCFDASGVSDW